MSLLLFGGNEKETLVYFLHLHLTQFYVTGEISDILLEFGCQVNFIHNNILNAIQNNISRLDICKKMKSFD